MRLSRCLMPCATRLNWRAEMHAQALTIAGSDSGGGAGIQADLKTFSALGVYGASAITAITAQNTRTVAAVSAVSPDMIAAQIDAVLSDLDIRAIKIGMLGDAPTIDAVAGALRHWAGPVVIDPVMVAKSGDALLADEAIAALQERMLPRATVLTPNLPEAARLLDCAPATTEDEMIRQGTALRALGAKAVLMKGGHSAGAVCTDLLIMAEATARFDAPRQPRITRRQQLPALRNLQRLPLISSHAPLAGPWADDPCLLRHVYLLVHG